MSLSPNAPPAPAQPTPERPPQTARKRVRRFSWRKIALIALFELVLTAVFIAAWAHGAFLSDLPPTPQASALYSLNAAPGMTFLDRNGVKIAARGPRHGERVRLAMLPAHVTRAFLAAEDRRFYSHGPVDWQGTARAAWANFHAGQVVQGGSTLTQQLARTLFLTSDQTVKRKIQEAVIAYRLEQRLSKDEVLELYLNRIFFGAQAYGIDAAAQTYFGKPARTLNLSEAALLAALPKAPSRLSPVNDMPAAVARSHTVLDRMQGEGWITPAQHAWAVAHPPVLASEPPEDHDFGWVLDMAQAEAARLSGGRAPDLVVRLAIDPDLQHAASDLVRESVKTWGRRSGLEEAALVALSPDGGVRAIVGGVDHSFSPFNRAAQARRQPGSAFKPFVYAAAVESGVGPSDIRQDAPFRAAGWSPSNYGGRYHGAVTVADALARSLNTVSVRLAQEAGPAHVAELAGRFGVSGIPPKPGLSIALGAYEVSLLDLTSAYQVFQQDGRRIAPHLVDQITTSGGELIYMRPQGVAPRVYDAARGGEMVRMMEGVVQRGTGKRANFGRPAAGKTGTSQTFRDAWFVGFTPDWVVGIWVGNDDSRPMHKVAGGDLPAIMWRQFMAYAHKDLPVRDFGFLGPEPEPEAPAATPPPLAPLPRQARERAYHDDRDDFSNADQGGERPRGGRGGGEPEPEQAPPLPDQVGLPPPDAPQDVPPY